MSNLNLDLYKKVFLIRFAEEAIQKYYHEDEMKTPMHMSMGSEAVVAGVCHALQPNSQVLGSYRSHALYLAQTLETDKFFAEMYGKSSGVANGKSGSMHMNDPDAGLLCCSAIVGSTIPLGLGVAFANKVKKNDCITAVFFGDGAMDEGVFWESINFACLHQLPLIFVCEDNQFAVHTTQDKRNGYSSITDVISKFNCHVFKESSTDVEVIYDLTRKAVAQMQNKQQPVFLQLQYYRYLEHVGIKEDFHIGYRDKKEFAEWFAKDPVKIQRAKLLNKSLIAEKELVALEEQWLQQINTSIQFAKSAPFPENEELYKGVFI